jgi:LPXTG-motif cell wall-anchored protein
MVSQRVFLAIASIATVLFVASIPNSANADAIVSTTPVGTSPNNIELSPDGSRLYVVNETSNSVSVIRTSDNTVISTVTVGTRPWDLALSPDGTRLYVTNFLGDSVSAIDTSTLSVVYTVTGVVSPEGIAVTPDGQFLFVASNDSTPKLVVISTQTHFITGGVPMGGGRLLDVVISPDGDYVYVSDTTANKVKVLDTATFVVTDKPVGNSPQLMSISADGTKLFISDYLSSQFQIVLTSNWTINTVSTGTGSSPLGIETNPSGERIYVAIAGEDRVNVYRTSDRTLIGQISTGSVPWGLAVAGDNTAYVSEFASNTVSVIKPASLSVSSPSFSGNVGSSLSGTVSAANFTPSATVTRTVSPALPSGLSLNATTGVVSGTPTSPQALTSYIVTGTDGTWTASTTIQIEVAAASTLPNTGSNTGVIGAIGALTVFAGAAVILIRRMKFVA